MSDSIGIQTAPATKIAIWNPTKHQSSRWTLDPEIFTATGAIGAATIAASAAVYTGRNQARRSARLARVNSQLADFYGPMLAHSSVNTRTFELFRKQFDGDELLFEGHGRKVRIDRLPDWERWMRLVFMPNNRAMVKLITTHTDLLEDDVMPACLTHLLAHISGYEVVLDQWARNDYSEHTSVVGHPGPDLNAYLQDRFTLLKKRQQKLLAQTRPRSIRSRPT